MEAPFFFCGSYGGKNIKKSEQPTRSENHTFGRNASLRAVRTGQFSFTDTIRFTVRFKFSFPENLMKKHQWVSLRVERLSRFRQDKLFGCPYLQKVDTGICKR